MLNDHDHHHDSLAVQEMLFREIERTQENLQSQLTSVVADPHSPLVYHPIHLDGSVNPDNLMIIQIAQSLSRNGAPVEQVHAYHQTLEKCHTLQSTMLTDFEPEVQVELLQKIHLLEVLASIQLIEKTTSMPIKNVVEMATIAKSNDLVIAVRDVNSASLPLFYRGAVGKDISTKPKSSSILAEVECNGSKIPLLRGQIPYDQSLSKIGVDRDFDKVSVYQVKAHHAVSESLQELKKIMLESLNQPDKPVIQIQKTLQLPVPLNDPENRQVFSLKSRSSPDHFRQGDDVMLCYCQKNADGQEQYYSYPDPRHPESIPIDPEIMRDYQPEPVQVIAYLKTFQLKSDADREDVRHILNALDWSDSEPQSLQTAVQILQHHFQITTAAGVVADEDIFTVGSKHQVHLDSMGLTNHTNQMFMSSRYEKAQEELKTLNETISESTAPSERLLRQKALLEQEVHFLNQFVSQDDPHLGFLTPLSAVATTSLKAATRENQGVQHGAECFRTLDCEPLGPTTFFYVKNDGSLAVHYARPENMISQMNDVRAQGYDIPVPRMLGWQRNLETQEFEAVASSIHVDSSHFMTRWSIITEEKKETPEIGEIEQRLRDARNARSQYYEKLLECPSEEGAQQHLLFEREFFKQQLIDSEKNLISCLNHYGLAKHVPHLCSKDSIDSITSDVQVATGIPVHPQVERGRTVVSLQTGSFASAATGSQPSSRNEFRL